jgi:hypothetical protein
MTRVCSRRPPRCPRNERRSAPSPPLLRNPPAYG